jgi:hypothetical protein
MSVLGYQLTEKFYSQRGYNGSQHFVAFCLTITLLCTVKKLDKSVVAVENPPTQEKEKII